MWWAIFIEDNFPYVYEKLFISMGIKLFYNVQIKIWNMKTKAINIVNMSMYILKSNLKEEKNCYTMCDFVHGWWKSYVLLLIRFVTDYLQKFVGSVKSIEGKAKPNVQINCIFYS